jgi:hypothetical protein
VSAFQPGPWYANLDNQVLGKCQMLTDDPQAEDDVIADVGGCGEAETARANARLIAAAPELHEALNAALEWFPKDTEAYERYCALLARIDGEAP